jgi:hypothetical protein
MKPKTRRKEIMRVKTEINETENSQEDHVGHEFKSSLSNTMRLHFKRVKKKIEKIN